MTFINVTGWCIADINITSNTNRAAMGLSVTGNFVIHV